MGAAYRVTAPYVTLKVKDTSGGAVVTGFYAGAVVSDVEAESLKHHLDTGLVEKISAAEVPTSAGDDDKGRKPASSKSA